MTQKNLFIKKPDGLRLVIPNDKFLAAWVVNERAILQEKNNINTQLAAIEERAANQAITEEERANLMQESGRLKQITADLRPYGILLYGYENAHEQLQMVRIDDDIKNIYNALPNGDKYTLCEAEGGHVCFKASALVQAEELKMAAIEFEDIELLEATLTSLLLEFGEAQNKQRITVLVTTPIDEIM